MSNEVEILYTLKKIQAQVDQMQKNNQLMPSNLEVLNLLKKTQEQVDEVHKSNRLMSPEHIAQALAFKNIKDEIFEMKNILIALTKNQS